jgi:ATP-dependent RNA helicase DDX49/DBP8
MYSKYATAMCCLTSSFFEIGSLPAAKIYTFLCPFVKTFAQVLNMAFTRTLESIASEASKEHLSDSEVEVESIPRPSKRRRLSQDSGHESNNSSDESDESDEPPTPPHPQTNNYNVYTVPSRINKQVDPDNPPLLSAEDLAELPSILHPRNASNKRTTTTSFTTLAISPWLLSTLRTLSITNPTPIQLQTIPPILSGADILASSPTGTGKTLAFALPILHTWARDPFGIYALVLTPTRELALQIYEQFSALGAVQDLKCVLVTGGSEMRPQALALARRPHVVVATPGRLADHIRQSGEDTMLGLRRCRVLVLDEADRLLDKKARMLDDLGTCLAVLPERGVRQTLLYTATMTEEVRALKDIDRERKIKTKTKGGDERDVVMVDLTQESEAVKSTGEPAAQTVQKSLLLPPTLKQTYMLTPSPQKAAYAHVLLTHLLSHTQSSSSASSSSTSGIQPQIIIFTNRTSTAQTLALTLTLLSHSAVSLHSLLPQSQRTANLAAFRAHTAKVLVATDVASRGLDIDAVAVVLNYDVPRDPADYVHRVGRTARAGRTGLAITLVGARDVGLVQAIEERVGTRMAEWVAEGDEVVNVETRVVRDGARVLREVGVARMEALRVLASGRDENGRVRRIRKKR